MRFPAMASSCPLPRTIKHTGQDKDCPGLVLRTAQVLSWENWESKINWPRSKIKKPAEQDKSSQPVYLDIDKEYKIHIQAHHHLACKKRTCRTRGSCFGGSVVLTPGHLLVTHPHRLARQVEIRYKDRWRISTWPIWILLFLSYCLAQYSHAACSPPASSASRICAWQTCSGWQCGVVTWRWLSLTQ